MSDKNTQIINYETGEIEAQSELLVVSDVRIAVEKAANVMEVMQINSLAKAAEAFWAAQGMEENAQKARAASLWAQRKAGEFLKAMPKNTGVRMNGKDSFGGNIVLPPNDAPTLQELDISKAEASRWQMLAEIPEETFEEYIDEKIEKGYELTAGGLLKIAKSLRTSSDRAEIAKAGEAIKATKGKLWEVFHGDIRTWTPPQQYDFIITDPPYPKEYLPLYEVLAERAAMWLKDGGLLIAMCGQSYLDEIYESMSKHLEYYWTAAYLTPGQPTPLRHRQVNTTWKPLLMFAKGSYRGKIFGDVFKSDGNDKSLHKWGQSESGMYDIVSKVCLPGQSILDPFAGAGTTLVAAVRHGCPVHGLELEEENVNIMKARLSNDGTA